MIVGLRGLAGSGKDTIAERLVTAHGFEALSFAAPIRRGLAAMFGLDESNFDNRAVKEHPLALLNGRSPRYAMQTLGTEWGRAHLGEDIWLQVCRAECECSIAMGQDRLVITDVRFPNEAAWLRSVGVIWHVVRPGLVPGAWARHVSESGVEIHGEDRGLVNDGTIDDLHARVDRLVEQALAA